MSSIPGFRRHDSSADVPAIHTAAEFEARRLELPEGGRFHELHDGQLKLLSTPEEIHGTIVFNISRMLATFLPQQLQARGYACFGLGLHVGSNPDTVYAPAISVFHNGSPFSQNDRIVASEIPSLVVDIASTNDRRAEMRLRTMACLNHGVETIWIPDPFKKEVQVISKGQHTLALGVWQTLTGHGQLAGFSMPVASIFAEPEWWDGKLPVCSTPEMPE